MLAHVFSFLVFFVLLWNVSFANSNDPQKIKDEYIIHHEEDSVYTLKIFYTSDIRDSFGIYFHYKGERYLSMRKHKLYNMVYNDSIQAWREYSGDEGLDCSLVIIITLKKVKEFILYFPINKDLNRFDFFIRLYDYIEYLKCSQINESFVEYGWYDSFRYDYKKDACYNSAGSIGIHVKLTNLRYKDIIVDRVEIQNQLNK